MKSYLITALIALVGGFGGAAAWSYSGLGNPQTREFLVTNPDILPEMADAYQAKMAQDRLAGASDAVRQPFPGAVLGNPQGKHTLVKFTDYGCGYCRLSVAEVDALVKDDPELRVVIREWPIFPGSEEAARMGLAAAKQGKFAAFYHAMFENGPPGAEAVERAARAAGLDMAEARTFAASEAVSVELAKNQAMAGTLGFSGTPSWVAGGELLEGAVGHERLAQAVAGGDD